MGDYLLMKEEVTKVVSKGKAASVLRLAFHDAGTFEMDDNSGKFQDIMIGLPQFPIKFIMSSCHQCRWYEWFYSL